MNKMEYKNRCSDLSEICNIRYRSKKKRLGFYLNAKAQVSRRVLATKYKDRLNT